MPVAPTTSKREDPMTRSDSRGIAPKNPEAVSCYHCGTPCPDLSISRSGKSFCCHGCETVFELLQENGLGRFYDLGTGRGLQASRPFNEAEYALLDSGDVRGRLVDFADDKSSRVTFRLPAIHCLACVWLLENLFRLNPAIGQSRVNFGRREVSITFDHTRLALSQLAGILNSIGYPPDLQLADLTRPVRPIGSRRLILQTGIAGFVFGNTMLYSISRYLGLSAADDTDLSRLFGVLSLLLSIPVVVYSAGDYWKTAWLSFRQRQMTMDVPIAAGILALFFQSIYEVILGRGEGYFDSMSGLIFFLLCGRIFAQATYHRLTFDRDYRAFFPLSVTRSVDGTEERISLDQLVVGDRVHVRNGELIPADSRLISGPALIDYSFVTGEAVAVGRQPGEHLYAGGRQTGATIEVETMKPVSQSYLTSLWDQDAFRKSRDRTFQSMTNRYSRRFTLLILAIALGSLAWWMPLDPARGVKAFVSVLIVACPCALALAAPFTLGTAQRILGRAGIFLRNSQVIEDLAAIDTIIFDKTGTLTDPNSSIVTFRGSPLSEKEATAVASLTRHSPHPCAVRITNSIPSDAGASAVEGFCETSGMGIEGTVDGNQILVGSRSWLRSHGITAAETNDSDLGMAHVAMGGHYRGTFDADDQLRPQVGQLIQTLGSRYQLALLSGDNERDRGRFEKLFPAGTQLGFGQSPFEKLERIGCLQQSGHRVFMVGDGLNDAGALRQSDVGAAVVQNLGSFSPASDVILGGDQVPSLAAALAFSKRAVAVVRISFAASALYNAIGVAIAAHGDLAPIVCAILMPLSSITVVVLACGSTWWMARRSGFETSAKSLPTSEPQQNGTMPLTKVTPLWT